MIFINKKIEFDDIILYSKNNIVINRLKIDYFYLWKKKLSFLEKYYKENNRTDNYDFFYYKGLSELALRLMKTINYNNITYGSSINRFDEINFFNDLYVYSRYGPIINTVAEYIKYEFFNNRRVEYEKIFDINLTKEDYYFLVARLLFTTYYFDLIKNNKIITNYDYIVNKIESYIVYIKDIIMSIKKRHNDMSLLEYIVNLL